MGCRRARPMFRDRQTGAGDDKSCCGRDVESFRRARASSGGVDETLMMAPDRNGAISNGLRHAGQLFDRFTFDGQNSKRRRHLRVGGGRIEQRTKKLPGFSTAEILAAHQAQRHLTQFEIADVNRLALEFVCSRWRWQQPTWPCDIIVIFRGIHLWNRSIADHPICVAIARAFAIARALLTVSSYSKCGFESATIPAPA